MTNVTSTTHPAHVAAMSPELAEYAATLTRAGFTVYLQPEPHRGLCNWFHYSRTIDGVERFGTVSDDKYGDQTWRHSMPIAPSRLNGSSAIIGGTWGDVATLGIDTMEPLSVAYAEAVARASNWCPFNAEPTPEAVAASNRPAGTPQRFYKGATLANATPGGIADGTYTPARFA